MIIALSRAAGIPARYITGLRYLWEDEAGGVPVEHAWLESYFPGVGWVAIDPTLGRSSTQHANYFTHHTGDHVIVTLRGNPSTLRGASYWSHLYWPGDGTAIHVLESEWTIELASDSVSRCFDQKEVSNPAPSAARTGNIRASIPVLA